MSTNDEASPHPAPEGSAAKHRTRSKRSDRIYEFLTMGGAYLGLKVAGPAGLLAALSLAATGYFRESITQRVRTGLVISTIGMGLIQFVAGATPEEIAQRVAARDREEKKQREQYLKELQQIAILAQFAPKSSILHVDGALTITDVVDPSRQLEITTGRFGVLITSSTPPDFNLSGAASRYVNHFFEKYSSQGIPGGIEGPVIYPAELDMRIFDPLQQGSPVIPPAAPPLPAP